MSPHVFLFVALFSFCSTSEIYILENIFSEICLKVKNIASCNRTLADSYKPRNPTLGLNEPATSVFLFTPTIRDVAEPLHSCGGELPRESTYDRGAETVIIIHGWLDGVCRSYWMREMKEQLFIRGRCNVILVDWTWGNTPDLIAASQNCKVVGEQVGFVLNNIMRQTGIGPEKFHVIGHSYGAMAAGYCGRRVKGKLRRITALDPAFDTTRDPPPKKITFRDASTVDVIHSAATTCPVFVDGRQLGHADFYPNGGAIQASCYRYAVISLLKGDIYYALAGLLVPLLCSHLQAIQYFKVSINPSGCEFVGAESGGSLSKSRNRSRAVMGMNYELNHPNAVRRKKYYLQTGSTCPYCTEK